MKTIYLISIALIVGLSACGQTGPLYLPKDAPKVYDEPSTQTEKGDKEKATTPEPPLDTTASEPKKSDQATTNPEPVLEEPKPAPKQPVPSPDKTEPTPEK